MNVLSSVRCRRAVIATELFTRAFSKLRHAVVGLLALLVSAHVLAQNCSGDAQSRAACVQQQQYRQAKEEAARAEAAARQRSTPAPSDWEDPKERQRREQESAESVRRMEESDRAERERERIRAQPEIDRKTGERVRERMRWYRSLVYDGLPRTQPGLPENQALYQFPQNQPLSPVSWDPVSFNKEYLSGELRERSVAYHLTSDELGDYGAALGLMIWDYSELVSHYRDFPPSLPDTENKMRDYAAHLRAYAVKTLTHCFQETHSADCTWILREIVRLRRDVLPATVDVAALERQLPPRSPQPDHPGGLDRARLGASGLGEHWSAIRALGDRETQAYLNEHYPPPPPEAPPSGPTPAEILANRRAAEKAMFTELSKDAAGITQRTLNRVYTRWVNAGLNYDPWSRLPANIEEFFMRDALARVAAYETDVTVERKGVEQELRDVAALKRAAALPGCSLTAATACMPFLHVAESVKYVSNDILTLLEDLASIECHAHPAPSVCHLAGDLAIRAPGNIPRKATEARRLAFYTLACVNPKGVNDGTSPRCASLSFDVRDGKLGDEDAILNAILVNDFRRLACIHESKDYCYSTFLKSDSNPILPP